MRDVTRLLFFLEDIHLLIASQFFFGSETVNIEKMFYTCPLR